MGVHTASITTGASAKPLFVTGPGAAGDGTLKNTGGSVGDELPTIIRNIDATNTVNIGDQGVTAAAGGGFPIKAGESFPVAWLGTDASALYGIAVAGTPIIVILAGRQ